jgi:hypothetical protein
MTVVILRLSSLDATEAMEAANELLSARDKYPVLRRTLVIDHAVALVDHTAVYRRLLTSKRLEHLLCVALGPLGPPGPEGQGPQLRIPMNLSSGQGSAVLWVSDLQGIDWQLSALAVADGHRGSSGGGLDYLIEVLSVDDVYDAVLNTMVHQVLDGMASPGLKLAGADDATVSFATALSLAIRRLAGPGSGPAEIPFASLHPPAARIVDLAEDGELAAYRDRVVGSAGAIGEALARSRGRLLRRAVPGVSHDVTAMGKDLRAFRDRVMRLFKEAQSAGELTRTQHDEVTAAGVSLPARAADQGVDHPGAGSGSGRSIVSQAVDQAIRSGDTLPRVIRRLMLTGQQLKHRGSLSYLPDVENICPSSLLSRLASPAPRPPGKAAAEAWQRGLGLEEATRAAVGLADLVVAVARREWSGGAAVAGEVSRTRIALDGIGRRLAEYADSAGTPGVSAARTSRLARLSENLTPFLCDLVGSVLAAESASPSSGGQEASERAQDKTGDRIAEWLKETTMNGPLSPPQFATSVVQDHTYADDDIAAIREAILYDPRQEMWQLCAPDDIGFLNSAPMPHVVAFAPKAARSAFGQVLPPNMMWTTSGSHAGLIRFVPLRASATWVERTDGQASADESAETSL